MNKLVEVNNFTLIFFEADGKLHSKTKSRICNLKRIKLFLFFNNCNKFQF